MHRQLVSALSLSMLALACSANDDTNTDETSADDVQALSTNAGRCMLAVGSCTKETRQSFGNAVSEPIVREDPAALRFFVETSNRITPWVFDDVPSFTAITPIQSSRSDLTGCPSDMAEALSRSFGVSNWRLAPAVKRATIVLSNARGSNTHVEQGRFPFALGELARGTDVSSSGSKLAVTRSSDAWRFDYVHEVYLPPVYNTRVPATFHRWTCKLEAAR